MAKKPTLNDISSNGFEAISTYNANQTSIKGSFDNTLSRDGSAPNQMEAELDLNSNKIINVGAPVSDADVASKKYVDDVVETLTSLDPLYLAILAAGLAARLEKTENLADLDDLGTARTNLDVYSKSEVDEQDQDSVYGPFGRAGIVSVAGKTADAHYGFGGWCETDGGKLVYVYRKGDTHAINNLGEVWYSESTDGGKSFTNVQKLGGGDGLSDWRVQKPRVLANGRVAFLVNRIDEAGGDYDPILFYSDDIDVASPSFSQLNLTRPGGSSAYSFDAHAGIIDFPLAQGGHDTEGFIAFGFISPVGFGYLSTVDNFATFAWETSLVADPTVQDAGLSDGPVTGLSETATVSIGSGRWLSYGRNKNAGGWRDEASCWAFTDLTAWGNVKASGVSLGGNPPAAFFDSATNLVHVLAPMRGGRFVGPQDHESWLMLYTADADALWAVGGDFASLSIVGEPFIPMPDWATFYADPKPYRGSFATTFTAGEAPEDVYGVTQASLLWMGDFVATDAGSKVVDALYRKRLLTRDIEVVAASNLTTEKPLRIYNNATTAYMEVGPYGTDYTGADYEITASHDLSLEASDDLLLTAGGSIVTTGPVLLGVPVGSIAGDSYLELNVAGASLGAASSIVGSASSKIHYRFKNLNGLVGSISTSGTATVYSTSSDPRLKTEFTDIDSAETWTLLSRLGDCLGKFFFQADLETEVLGFDAHKILDLKGLGSEIGVEGMGPRDAAIGSTFLTEDGEQAEVTGASVDYSKTVPYLLAAILDLQERVKELES